MAGSGSPPSDRSSTASARARRLVSYEPNPVLAWLYHRFFEHIKVDEAWAAAVRDADARGTVIYALRNLSFVDFLALDYLTKRLALPQVRFANDLGLWVLEPMGRGWLQALRPHDDAQDAEDLKRAVREGASAALFLKRPPRVLGGSNRGRIEGDPYVRALLDLQREMTTPILLVPQVFVWSRRADDAGHDLVDAVLGPREWPGRVRIAAQFLGNYRHVTLRAGEPLDLRAFLDHASVPSTRTPPASAGTASSPPLLSPSLPPSPPPQRVSLRPPSDDVLVRRLTYALLRRLERERRSVIGPTRKPADRVRDEVIRSPRLQKIIHEMAGEGERERAVITARALGMLKELEASLDVEAVAALQKVFDQVTSRIYAGIEVDQEGLARVRQASKDGTLVFLPSHKSHVDYMVLADIFLKHHLQLPLIAAGDNLSFFPLGAIFRRAGAFFIRRSFGGDRLYGAVVDAYVRRLVKDGRSLEFFIEGGRSRTGKLLSPKMGLLSLVVDATLGASAQRVFFCPISIGYERVVEEKSFVHELSGGEKRREDVRSLLATAGLMADRYGSVNVQFGELLTLQQVLQEFRPDAGPDSLSTMTPARRRALVTRLAYRAMNEINRVTAVTPGALVATALLTHGRRGLSHDDLVAACTRLASTLHAFGARFTTSLAHPTQPGNVRAAAITEACDLFVRAGHVVVHRPDDPPAEPAPQRRTKRDSGSGFGAIYVVPDAARLSLDLSKNIVVHFFVARAMVATSLLGRPDALGPAELGPLAERVRALSRLFKFEFQFRADAPFERNFGETIDGMVADGELQRDGEGSDAVRINGDRGRAQVTLYAQVVRNFVESYRIAARGLSALLKGPLTPKELTKRSLSLGERMFLAGEVARREAVSRPVLENAEAAFIDQGYLRRVDTKLSLSESYASPATVRTIEARIVGFLPMALDPSGLE